MDSAGWPNYAIKGTSAWTPHSSHQHLAFMRRSLVLVVRAHYLMNYILMSIPALLFLLPIAIPKGKWLVSYLIFSSLVIAGIWIQSFHFSPDPVGHHSPGEGLGLVIIGFFTLMHVAGATTRILYLAFRHLQVASRPDNASRAEP
jgi:hypothetical protein